MPHADHKYIEALLKNDSKLIEEIYSRFSKKIESYVIANSGSELEAKDIFQEALISIYRKAKYDGFELTCPFEAYFFMVCRGKWLNVLASAKKKKETKFDAAGFTNVQAQFLSDETIRLEERLVFLEHKLTELGDSCQSILKLSWKRIGMQEVADQLNLSYAYVRKKKSECVAKLMTLIKEDPNFEKLKSE